LGDKVEAEERDRIQKAIESLKEVLKGNDKAEIERQTESLAEVSGKMAERLYGQQGAAAAGDGASTGAGAGMGAEAHPGAGAGTGADAAHAKESQEDVVDAEFEEVKEKGKGK
jgi:molecular chaperone DnaK